MVQAEATAKYVRTSAQKAGLVLELIRGKDVNHALSTLAFARKSVAKDIEKVLRSAIANASTKEGFGGDVDRLYVAAAFAGQGPSLKRVRPAPMGRAFRVVKRSAHLTVKVAERPEKKTAVAAGGGAKAAAPARPRGAKPKKKSAGAKPKQKATGVKPVARGAKKTSSKAKA
ncbi:MAG: 50S ribosomal protein L22 [Acidobacteriota bacterium]|nr:50S ribosomal protein L22 [Acidobacteriota bacterium]